MKEKLVNFETAKLAKEKGFTISDCEYKYMLRGSGDGYDIMRNNIFHLQTLGYPAPTQSLLQKWLREVHNLYVWSFPENNGETFGWEIDESYKDKYKELPEGDYDLMEYNYNTYEEALEVGLQEALKLIELKK
jgi:hypothetical protein